MLIKGGTLARGHFGNIVVFNKTGTIQEVSQVFQFSRLFWTMRRCGNGVVLFDGLSVKIYLVMSDNRALLLLLYLAGSAERSGEHTLGQDCCAVFLNSKDQFVQQALFHVWSSVLACFAASLFSGTLLLKGVCGNACPNSRVVRGNAHPVCLFFNFKAAEHHPFPSAAHNPDLVEETFGARFQKICQRQSGCQNS